MTKHQFHHIPIMVKEVVSFLNSKPGQIIVDGTAGGGGHLAALKRSCSSCQLIGIDQDEESIETLRQKFLDRVIIVQDNFRNIVLALKKLGIKQVDAMLLDLGVSTHQLETDYRGFSFNRPAPLDMRMDNRRQLTASSVVNQWSAKEITRILQDYGQEPFARKIAQAIVHTRHKKPIETTNDLVEIIRQATPPSYRYSRAKTHFATNTFRALRMAVNDELGALESFLKQAPTMIKAGGKLAIVTFHSLEDRLVKQAFQSWQGTATDSKPTNQEIVANPKARSARLRGFTFFANN